MAKATDTTQFKRRLGNAVNSYQPVVMPVLSYDGKRLYFSRKYHPENIGSTKDPDDIWYCERVRDSLWSEPKNLGAPLNTSESNVLCSISPDGTALIQTTKRSGSTQSQTFALTTFNGTNWSVPKPITIRNYQNKSPN